MSIDTVNTVKAYKISSEEPKTAKLVTAELIEKPDTFEKREKQKKRKLQKAIKLLQV